MILMFMLANTIVRVLSDLFFKKTIKFLIILSMSKVHWLKLALNWYHSFFFFS